MAKLKIFPLDDPKEENASVLVDGEHIIGRGFLNCHDKRVSRKHALITISNDSIMLKAIHVNPCFHKKAGGKIIILPKDISILLGDGDQFSFLADDFWFKVKIIKGNKEDTNAENLSNGNITIENGNGADLPPAEASASDTLLNDMPSTSKRTHEVCLEDESSKRFKVSDSGDTSNAEDASHERVKSNLSAMLDKMLSSSSDVKMENSGPDDQSIDSNQLMNRLSDIVKEDYGETNDKDNLQVIGKKEVDGDEVKPNVKTEGEDISSEAGPSGNVKTEDSGDVQNTSSAEDAQNNLENDGNKTDQNENVVVKTEQGDDKGGTSANTGDNQGKASSSNDDNNKTRRERCWYGPTCYRRNPIHRADFSHPGDADYDSDPDDDRPPCPFGGLCYRKNMLHRRQYKHPNPPAPKQNDGGVTPKKKRRPKKRPTGDNSGSGQSDDNSDNQTRKKRKAAMKKVNYDSPDDDYDYEDPFINDASSDEFKISSDDSDDSTDWEDSQKVDEESQETRRLLKEAQKFTKGKGKK